MFINTPRRFHIRFLSLMAGMILLSGCSSSKKQLTLLDRIQNHYNSTVTLNERYAHNFYGKADPASFERLKKYRYESYQALMKLRATYEKEKSLPQDELQDTKTKIDAYQSYLNALGATSATKDNLIGF